MPLPAEIPVQREEAARSDSVRWMLLFSRQLRLTMRMTWLLGLAVVASAQTNPASALVAGKVVDAATSAPLGKVQIRLEPTDPQRREDPIASTTTDAQGNFSISEVKAGGYVLRALRSGYSEAYYVSKAGAPRTELRVEDGQQLSGLTIRMTSFGIIAGVVRDVDGEPLADVPVTLLHFVYEQRVNWRRPDSKDARTNDLGEYRFANLPPGEYFLKVGPPFNQQNLVDRSSGHDRLLDLFVTTYYPGTEDPAAATPLRLPPGGRLTSTDLVLGRSRGVRVSGEVIYGPEMPSGGSAQLSRGRWGQTPWVWTYPVGLKNGRFEFPSVPPGPYDLTVGGGEYRAQT